MFGFLHATRPRPNSISRIAKTSQTSSNWAPRTLAKCSSTQRPMGWSFHAVPVQKAVAQGLVERIAEKTGRPETDEQFLGRLRAECIDDEQWLQEYCCVPADESAAFITYEMIQGCSTPDCLKGWKYLAECPNPLFLGVDVARKKDLCVLDVGEKVGDIVWDRMRIELQDRSF